MRVCHPSGGRDLRVPGGTTPRGKEGSAAVSDCSLTNQGTEPAAGKPFFQRPARPMLDLLVGSSLLAGTSICDHWLDMAFPGSLLLM